MESQLRFLKSWNMMLLKCFIWYVSKFGKTAMATEPERSVFIPIPKKGNAKECSNYHKVARISHPSNIMLKILQARLQQYVNWELLMSKLDLKKTRGTRDQIGNICWAIGKAREFQKNIYFCFLDYAKAFDSKLWKYFKTWEYQMTFLASWEICMQVKKQQLEQDMEQWTGS